MLNITMIIPSLNREKTVKGLLDDISQFYIDDIPDEIIVVDQSDLPYNLDFYKETMLTSIIHVKEKKKSSPRARNIGLTMAKNDIIIYCDDDILLDKEIFSNVGILMSNKKIAMIAGHLEDNTRRKYSVLSYLSLSSNFFIRKTGHITKSIIGSYPRKILNQTLTSYSIGGFMVIRKNIACMEKVEWDENLPGHGYPDDLDFSFRYSLKANKRGMYSIISPDVKLKHVKSEEYTQKELIYDFSFIVNRYYISNKLFGTLESIIHSTIHNVIYSLYILFKDSKKSLLYIKLIKYSFKNFKKVKAGELETLFKQYIMIQSKKNIELK